MEAIFHHPLRIIATLFVSSLWGFVAIALALSLGKLVIQRTWATVRWLTHPRRLRRRVIADPVRVQVNPDFRMPDDDTLARWLHEAAPAEWTPDYPDDFTEAFTACDDFPQIELDTAFF